MGDVSNFSFYFGHHMTSIEGGVVCTNNDEIYQYAKLFRSHGMTREASTEVQQEYIKERKLEENNKVDKLIADSYKDNENRPQGFLTLSS